MKKNIISYASMGYYTLQDRFMKSVLNYNRNISEFYFTDKWLKWQSFYKRNIEIFSLKRGYGYWLWKPYIIKERLEKMKDGDLLLYCDVDIICTNELTPLFNLCKQNKILLFRNGLKQNKEWTKRDCFILMNADSEEYYNAFQVNAAIILLEKSPKSVKFVDEWIKYAQDIRILTDKENSMGLNNLDTYIEHRHDQSILSILSKKHNIDLFRDPSEYGNPYKIAKVRRPDDYLENGYYDENNILENSEYDTSFSFKNEDVYKKNYFNKLQRIIYHIKPFIC
jgi:hypothetical protein